MVVNDGATEATGLAKTPAILLPKSAIISKMPGSALRVTWG